MTTDELELRWKAITYTGALPYRSLRISAGCRPELYIALDMKANRFLILQVPEGISVNCPSIKMENLSIEWHEETRFILIGLLNIHFSDLFNDLTLSIYNRVKDSNHPEVYTETFVQAFHRWSEFFEDSSSVQLSEFFLKGLFGELTVLKWYLENNKDMSADHILFAWQGPYNRSQDFVFPGYNLEIKTKSTDEVNISISSEYQLQAETGKRLLLGIVNTDQVADDGITLQHLITDIRNIIILNGADMSVFLKTIARSGLNFHNASFYNHFKWKAINIILYDCSIEEFPKITTYLIRPGISQVKYNLNTTILDSFIIQNISL